MILWQTTTGRAGLSLKRFGVAGRRHSSPRPAALPGTHNLIVLEPRVLAPWRQRPLDEIDWPGSLTSQDGRCPEGLRDVVHYRRAGTKHAALDAWESGQEFVFEEPEVTTASLAA